MQALVLDHPGSLDALRLADVPLPDPGPGDVRVRVHAAGLNPVDYKLAASGHPRWRYPHILGLDVAGVIDALGSAVTGWQVGAPVYYHGNLAQPGGFAEYALVPAYTVAPLPSACSFVDAAALPCAGWTAYQALYRKLHIHAGQTILIHGGAGGVGGFAVQLAAYSGLEVITTCSPANNDYVRRLGAPHVIDYTREDVAARVMDLTNGRGVDAIVDTVSAASAVAGLDLLAFGGGIACVAGFPDTSKLDPFLKPISIHAIALGGAYQECADRRAQEDLAALGWEFGALVDSKKIDPMLSEVIGIADIPAALQRLAKRHVRGKIVAQIV